MNKTDLIDLGYLVAAVCFILALKGLSGPKTARRGNQLGAAGAALAVLLVFVAQSLDHVLLILATIAVGSLVGVVAARRVAMTQMPQLVAIFNGVGGGAAALVAFIELPKVGDAGARIAVVAALFTLIVGGVSFAGSAVTFAKLQELMTTRPVTFPGGPVVFAGLLGLDVVTCGWAFAVSDGDSVAIPAALVLLLSLFIGVLFVLPVGGADVPIVISLLNAFTGLTVAASGYVITNTLLIVAGTLVGASGTILTRMMAAAMGRSVVSILFGAFKGGSTAGSTEVSDRPVRQAGAEDVAVLLAYARKIIVIPGYGLAVAQAQHVIHELVGVLKERGVEVSYGIHPVAGRMPGHMNVLLAEASVPYEQLQEMDEANSAMSTTDVALVVGANDVVNPAARADASSPIYGMPILAADEAKACVFLKRSMRPGFAGIENELLFDPNTTLLFGDAKDSLTKVLAAVKAL